MDVEGRLLASFLSSFRAIAILILFIGAAVSFYVAIDNYLRIIHIEEITVTFPAVFRQSMQTKVIVGVLSGSLLLICGSLMLVYLKRASKTL